MADLKEWLGRDEIYTYWGRKASRNEKNPELMFIDPRPWVKRKPSPDFEWGIVLKESNKVVGMIAVFDIQNARMGDIAYRVNPEYWNMGITTEALKEVVRFIFENTEIDRFPASKCCIPSRSLSLPAACVILRVCHGEGVDDHGQICPEEQAEQEGSEGTEPSAANNVGLQSRQQGR